MHALGDAFGCLYVAMIPVTLIAGDLASSVIVLRISESQFSNGQGEACVEPALSMRHCFSGHRDVQQRPQKLTISSNIVVQDS